MLYIDLQTIFNMKLILVFVASFCLQQNIFSQTTTPIKDTTKSKVDLEEVVVSSSNFSEKKKNIAQKIDVISAKTIETANAQSTGDLLVSTGKIFVQKSQQGGSSPVLRGFEASRILLVVDGVRMNNAIYRSGHLQNAITVDQNSLSRIEVMYGPSSTVYGSDALGGTIHLITKAPLLSTSKKIYTTGTSLARYSSVNNEKTIHLDASIAGEKFGWYQAYNFSDFGDLKMGSNFLKAYPNFGKRDQYIDQINGIDSVINNSNNLVQKFSGYKQWDIVQKLLYNPNEYISHSLNFQTSSSTNIPRYDRLQDEKDFGGSIGKTLRFAEWNYGPQKRALIAYGLSFIKPGFFKEVKFNVNYQKIEESRITREYRRMDRYDKQIENVKVFGASINGRRIIGNNEIVIGADIQFNNVISVATRTNLNTGIVSKLNTRYPDGKNRMNNLGIYAQHTYKFKNGKVVLNDGLRIQAIHLVSNIIDNSFFKLPDTAVTQNNIAFTGNVGAVYTISNTTVISSAISSGFRAPNIDDLSKVFESNPNAKQVVLPNANLKPEYTYNIDLTIRKEIKNFASVELTGFYSLFRNAIIKAPFALNGQDSIIFDGVKSQVLASQNINKAALSGFSVAIKSAISKKITFNGTLSYTKGMFITDNTKPSAIYERQNDGSYRSVNKFVSKKPLDHISPLMGKANIAYAHKMITTEINVLFNGWKRLDQFNADGEDNAQYATKDGMPAWLTCNWKGNIELNKNIKLQLGIDNIFDRNYRYFASGFSAGGRNYFIALRVSW
jgi:hemoglobin/transferrin/lactoferrin receptor protein